MSITEYPNTAGELENDLCLPQGKLADYPNIILLQPLVNSIDDGEDTDSLQQYEIINSIPFLENDQLSLISSGNQQSTIIPVRLDIQLDKTEPTRSIQAKTWVPENEMLKNVSIEKYLDKGSNEDSSNSNQNNAEGVNKYQTVQKLPLNKKLGQSNASAPNVCKTALEAQMESLVLIHDKPAQPRAFAVIPNELQYRRGLVSPRRALPACVRFGPVQGIIKSIPGELPEFMSAMEGRPVFLQTCDYDSRVTYINVMDLDKSNWMGLLPLGDENTANVWIYQYKNELYGVTVKPLAASTPLRIGYSKDYAQMYGIVGQPTLDILAVLPTVQSSHWCSYCCRSFSSKRVFDLHGAKYHEDPCVVSRGAYRCKPCGARFTRKFGLKRHQLIHCTKIQERAAKTNSPTKAQMPPTQNGGFTAQQNGADDSNRLPSDESLQNYTNILDISTNLFDTDRIPNLDISGSVKSDNEFNPLGFKDDSHLANDFSFTNGLMDDLVVGETPNVKQERPRKVRSSSPFSCPYCKTNVPRSKLKQHAQNCMAQRFLCVCGRKYRRKIKMEAHIRVCDIVKNSKALDNPYTCAECSLTFKRRGMYVNHLTKCHAEAAAVPEPPLVVPDRRYPCPGCDKFYKTQAKRHAHVLTQHPGLKYDHKKTLVCGSKSLQPAKCWVCPKQYGTRSKLLQHVRASHPDSVPPEPFTLQPQNTR